MGTKIKTEPVWPPNVAKAVTVMMSSSKDRNIIIFWTPKGVEEFKQVTPNNNRRSRGHSRKEKKLNKTETNGKKINSSK